MKTSEKGKKFLIEQEGNILEIYLDTSGYKTCGCGHLIVKEDPEFNMAVGTKISLDRSMELLTKDLQIVENCLEKWVDIGLTQSQIDALVSFIFNLGETQFSKSTLLKYLNEEHLVLAASEFTKWSKAYNPKTKRKDIVPGILARRQREAKLFSEGIYG